MIATLPNNTTHQRLFMRHELAFPACCPISKNPRPGSHIAICYRAKEEVLEVGSLTAYIGRYVGGLRGDDNDLVVRTMEGMITRIADDCAAVLGVPVKVTARLLVLPREQMSIIARGYPEHETMVPKP